MKNIVVSFVFMLFLVSCGGGGSNNTTASSSSGDSIVGEWLLIYDGSLCEETYDFNSNNAFVINSLDEQVAGEYSVSSVSGNGERKRITLTILTDNGLSDCEGDSTDDSDTVGELFFEIDEDTLYWFETSSSVDVLAEMERQ